MRYMNKKVALSILLLFLSFTLLTACSTQKPDNEDSAPSFELNDLNGDSFSLEKLADEKVYIKYWASWCSACLAGLEDIDQLSSQDTDFRVITIVNPGYKGEMKSDNFKEWFNSLEFDNTTVLLDEEGTWAKEFRVVAYPASYFIDSEGLLVKMVLGNQPNSDIINEFTNIN